jgi:uncharacterized protein (DUF58 family)
MPFPFPSMPDSPSTGAAPAIDWASIRAASARFRLAMPRGPLGGKLGERLGSGSGSSLEFQDYRHYAPGDDLRHIDWAAYARSEVLAVRLYREEVAPRIDLVLDVSRSIAVTPEKQRAYAELAGLIACASASLETDVRVVTTAATEPRPLRRPEDLGGILRFDANTSALEESPLPLRPRSIRVAVSDFLFPHDPEALVRRLARGGAALSILQLTLAAEAEPAPGTGVRMIDAEGGGQLDLIPDEQAVKDYRDRFLRLRAGLALAARRAGTAFVPLTAETPLAKTARALARAGIFEAA